MNNMGWKLEIGKLRLDGSVGMNNMRCDMVQLE